MGFDVGTKTIGIAVTDPLRLFPQPVRTVKRRGVEQDVRAIRADLERWAPTALVVGLPYELDGSESRSARLARQVGERLREVTELPLYYVDERFTSVEAERDLIATNMRRDRRKQVIDQAAAMKILERWLEDERARS